MSVEESVAEPSGPVGEPRHKLQSMPSVRSVQLGHIEPPSPESPSIKTSKLINMPPLSPVRVKLANEMSSQSVYPTQKLEVQRSLRASRSFNTTAWQPFCDASMPPNLRFDSWWFESGQRFTMHISYDTAMRVCTASMNVTVSGTITSEGMVNYTQRKMEPWDLHVGAKIRLLGRLVTLRKAYDQATLDWLDETARKLLKERDMLQKQMEKYRQVRASHPQYADAQRSERMGNQTHQQTPTGGRVNLRRLRENIEQLVVALRQHQLVLPKIKSAVTSDLMLVAAGPTQWLIEDLEEKKQRYQDQHKLQQKRRSEANAPRKSRGQELLEPISLDKILSVPLAASAAGMTKGAAPRVRSPPLKSNNKSRHNIVADAEGKRTRPTSPKGLKASGSGTMQNGPSDGAAVGFSATSEEQVESTKPEEALINADVTSAKKDGINTASGLRNISSESLVSDVQNPGLEIENGIPPGEAETTQPPEEHYEAAVPRERESEEEGSDEGDNQDTSEREPDDAEQSYEDDEQDEAGEDKEGSGEENENQEAGESNPDGDNKETKEGSQGGDQSDPYEDEQQEEEQSIAGSGQGQQENSLNGEEGQGADPKGDNDSVE